MDLRFDDFHRVDLPAQAPDQAAVHARIGGEGPPVLLLHGFPQNLHEWAHVAPWLARTHTVVCADLRGYGGSGKPLPRGDMGNYSFRAMAGDLLRAMDTLGFERFHVIGHDRGARVAHRLALDQPARVRSLALLDIAPTVAMFGQTDARIARAYWHWYFMQQPAPYPETLIAGDPDHFHEAFFFSLGGMRPSDFDASQLAAYRAAWRDRAFIAASCADYRAAAWVDVVHDAEDAGRRVDCPALVCWGADGVLPTLFDLPALWGDRLARMRCATVPGGHFFVDQHPRETAVLLADFLHRC